MCDQTEVPYLPDDVVWVKLGPVWWPGRVCRKDEIPPEIIKDLRKTPIAIVKFFQEDSFEYVKKLSNIYHYNCLRKNEFIKKGLDMLRSKNRDAPSNLKLFPQDIVKAECLTGGNPAILQDDVFLPEEKPTYADLFATTKKTPKKVKSEVKKKSPPVKPVAPRLITHPRFLQLSSGQATDYEARERKQEPLRAECDEEDNSPPTTYRCTECEYTTTRLNVMVWHNKSHTRNYASPVVSSKATKRKSTTSVKFKQRLSTSVEFKRDVMEEVSNAKIPKTNGTLKERIPKTPGRKKLGTPKRVVPVIPQNTKEINTTPPIRTSTPIRKPKRVSVPKTDEFQNSLLEDWPEDDMEQDNGVKTNDSLSVDSSRGDTKSPITQDVSNISSSTTKGKSCFDFDDSEDHIIIDKSKFKLGRKIPRVLDDVKSVRDALIADNEIKHKSEPMEVDPTPSSNYHSGVVDSAVAGDEYSDESPPNQTTQLQEMGVDNEIEIKTEETVSDGVVESMPTCGLSQEAPANAINVNTDVDDKTAELRDKVDKLLAEISTPIPKLSDIPRSHKKAHLKAYCESLAKQNALEQSVTNSNESALAETHDIEVSSIPLPSSPRQVTNVPPVKNVANVHLTASTEALSVQATADINAFSEPSEIKETFVKDETSLSKEETVVKENEMSVKEETSSVKEEPLVVEDGTPVDDEKPAIVDGVTVSDEKLVVDSGAAVVASSTPASNENGVVNAVSPTEPAFTTTTSVPRTHIKFTTTPKLKPINANQLLKGAPCAFQIINPTDEKYKSLLTKSSAAAPATGHPLSPNKIASGGGGGDQAKTIRTTLKTPDGKSIICNLTTQSPKILLANSQSTGSPTKFILVNRPKAAASPSVSVAGTNSAATLAAAGRTIGLTNATAVRLTQNILQSSPQKTTATLTKSGKNIVLNASNFQMLLQSQLSKTSSPIVLPDTATESTSSSSEITTSTGHAALSPVVAGQQSPQIAYVANDETPTSITAAATAFAGGAAATAADQTVNFSYIVDGAGHLVTEAASNATHVTPPSRDKDILAKALENTDGLQTEMALSNEASNSNVLDSCSVAQNTELAYKTDTVYENLTLSTPPIMSAYETPSRAATAATEVANEMLIVRNSVTAAENSTEYIT